MHTQIYVFDAYGTLFDVHSAVSRYSDIVGESPARVSEIWRTKQLEYTWTRNCMRQYQDFWQITSDALDFALEAVPGSNRDSRNKLLDAYMSLDCYEEVPAVLKTLQSRGAKTAILSNGTSEMIASAVKSSGIAEYIDAQFSVDTINIFKTDPEAYKLAIDKYGFEPGEVAFQSSNRWDIAGAAAFGFQCNWINRSGQPDEYKDLPPANVLSDLNGLV